MKKIETKALKDKKQKRNQILLGIIMIALLVLSTAGFALLNQDSTGSGGIQKVNYNGFEFYKQDNYWILQSNNKALAFINLPSEVEDVEINITSNIGDIMNKALYVVNGGNLKDQIQFNLVPEFALRTSHACLSSENCSGDYPVKNCKTDNIIVFENSEDSETKIYQEDKCIFVNGNSVKGNDKLIQEFLGIK